MLTIVINLKINKKIIKTIFPFLTVTELEEIVPVLKDPEFICVLELPKSIYLLRSVFPEPLFSGGQLTPSFKNRGSMQIFEGQLGLTHSG